MSAQWPQAPEPGFEAVQPQQDPEPGTSSKGHDHLVFGERTSQMEPPVQLICQGLSPDSFLGPPSQDHLLPPGFDPRSSGGLLGS